MQRLGEVICSVVMAGFYYFILVFFFTSAFYYLYDGLLYTYLGFPKVPVGYLFGVTSIFAGLGMIVNSIRRRV